MSDPFAVLGLGRLSTAEEVHAAYRALAKACHPDLNRTDEEAAQKQMVRLNVAYAEALKEIERRGEHTVLPDAFAVAKRLYERGLAGSALRILDRAPQQDGEWFALQGAILLRLGEAEAAHESYRAAVRMEPGNTAYRAGALEAAVRLRRQQTAFGRVARWARRMVRPAGPLRAK